MIQANPGNLLKFNRQKFWQRHKQPGQDIIPFGLLCPTNRVMSFQLYFPSGAGVATWKLVNPADPSGASFTAMSAADLTIETADSGAFWVTWYGVANLTTIPACGFWEVWVTVDGTTYYSEVLQTFATGEGQPTAWRMRLGNDTDKGTVLYQGGYQNYFYPKRWAWDRVRVERDQQQVVDGNGAETTLFTRTTERLRLEVSDLPDYVANFFAKCGDLDGIIFEDTIDANSVILKNVSFDMKNQGVALNTGTFTFDAEVEAFNDCQENFILA